MSRRWHYTPGCHLPSILADGLITTASSRIDPGERPAVWFSEQTFWEPTVHLVYGLAATIRRFGYVARIEVAPDVCPVSWREFKRTSGVSSRTARKLEKSGRVVGGHPELWWVSYEAVRRERWLSVEVLDAPDGVWRKVG
jgi:hypothetical protein